MSQGTKKRIGFIGLGIMGMPMAKNLLKAGYQVIAYNRTPAKVDRIQQLGARRASSPKEVALQSEVIITMLPGAPEVEQVMLGENGVIEGIRPGSIVIDMSSIDPFTSKKLALAIEEKGAHMLDAPVSGGEPGAIAGTLSIMVGGKQEVFDEVKDILLALGKNVVRVGPNGSGSYAKLANQILVALHIAAMSEAFVFAQKAGLDPEILYEAIKNGLAGSNVLDSKLPLVLNRRFEPGGKITLQVKDLHNALMAAKSLSVPLPLTGLVHQFFLACVNAGDGDKDHCALVNLYEGWAGAEVKKRHEN